MGRTLAYYPYVAHARLNDQSTGRKSRAADSDVELAYWPWRSFYVDFLLVRPSSLTYFGMHKNEILAYMYWRTVIKSMHKSNGKQIGLCQQITP